MLKMRNYKLLGYIFQAVTIMLGVSFVWNHHSLIGIILFAITIFADTGLSSVRKDFTRMSVKLLLLLYGILLWFIFVTPSRVQHIKPSNGDTTLYARTRNITPRRTRAHNHPIKRSESKVVRSGKVEKLGGETIATVQRIIQKPEAINTLRRKISSTEVHSRSISLLAKVFGDLPTSDFADLKYRAGEEVRYQLERVFAELPPEGFLNTFKNPCWKYKMEMNENIPRTLEDLFTGEGEEQTSLACLPYAYILGQPKCGTSDLFERLKVHPDIRMPHRKEVRWFTRGEFTTQPLVLEGYPPDKPDTRRRELGLSDYTSIFSFTNAFDMATREISAHQDRLITIDGGPHTLWWPTQQPNGDNSPDSIPAPQIIREMQPNAKFIITLADPVQRLYSDYYFLEDDRTVVKQRNLPGKISTKSAKAFHERSLQQINQMKTCIREEVVRLLGDNGGSSQDMKAKETAAMQTGSPYWFRASQICAHDRFNLGKAGWGRLSIGLYVLYVEKWLEHFAPSQFLVLRLEDYDIDPKTYMQRVFTFLSVEVDALTEQSWSAILHAKHANAYHGPREPILEETERMLREFHEPYNKMLASLVDDSGFVWAQGEGTSLRIRQLLKDSSYSQVRPGPSVGTGTGGVGGGGVGGIERERGVESEASKAYKLRKQKDDAFKAKIQEQRSVHRADSDSHGRQALPNTANIGGPEEGEMEGEAQEDNEVQHNLDRHGVHKHFVEDKRTKIKTRPRVRKNGKDARLIEEEEREEGEEGGGEGEGGGDMEGEGEEGGSREEERGDRGDSRGDSRSDNRGDNRPEVQEVIRPNRTIEFTPQRFSVEGLESPEDGLFNEWLGEGNIIEADNIYDELTAARQLNIAAFGLDLNALRYLLWDTGVPPNMKDRTDGNRNAMHCLCMVHTMSDAHSRSQVFAVLKGKPTWLTPYIQPPTPLLAHSVLSRDIRDGLSDATLKAAKWLLRAGVDAHAPDVAGYTPLHHAAVGGMESLVRILLEEAKVTVNVINKEGRTPLHYAAAYGHAVVAGLLLDAGADPDIEDKTGTRASDIMSNPGPMSAADAKKYLNIEQRPVRKIERKIHPENLTNGETGGWSAGTGGWGNRRLKGYEEDMSCDVDQYWAHEITDEDIYNKYLARGAPVLIRGLVDNWPVVQKYAHDSLRSSFGHLEVTVSDIPYAGKFGGAGNVEMSLSEYIDEVKEHRLVGGKHPWYVFRGHPVPSKSEDKDSLVKWVDMPTPPLLQKAFERMIPSSNRGRDGVDARDIYVNSQWALGGEGTGAPVHFHNTAWNALIYGAKKWILYPPHSMIMSNKQILDYFETDMKEYADRGVQGQSCVQVAGDVMIIPESWGHGVLNLQESVAVATEVKANVWRSKPPSAIIGKLPNDNRPQKIQRGD